MHSIGERPRELRWYHAAGLLFGDWGTSRLYVLGIAFVASGHAAFWYVAAMCALVTVVGFSYTIVCAHFPDGGGVYSAAKKRSDTLAVLGALLLIADYTVTAALSAYEGFRYMLPESLSPSPTLAWALAISALVGMGVLNVFGPRRVSVLAIVIAILSGIFYFIIGLFCLPHLSGVVIHAPTAPPMDQWRHFVNVILALSGVEAIANMTGVMAEPVARNARRAIFVVLAEVVLLNLIFAYAMNGLPQLQGVDTAMARGNSVPAQQQASDVVLVHENGAFISEAQHKDYADHMVKIIATGYVGPWFATVASFFFGLLLLSAANTAIGAMISVQYLLARDKEMPQSFTRLNRFGVPWVGLITATLIPAVVLGIVGPDSTMLAGLYAIGVVGAISINLFACGTNFKLDFKKWERATLLAVGSLTVLIWITIAWQKWQALLFACVVVGVGFTARTLARRKAKIAPAPEELAEAKPLYESAIRQTVAASQPRILVPTRGNPKLLKFAAGYAKDKKAAMFVLFVREIALAFRERGGKIGAETMTLGNDREAQEIFARVRKICEEAGVPLVPLYAVSDSAADLILDHAATLGVDAVLMGVSQRGALWKTLRGDVLQEVIAYLPESIPLLIHA